MVRLSQQEIAQTNRPDNTVIRAHDEQVLHDLGQVLGPQSIDGFRHAQFVVQDEEVSGHQPARALGVVADELAQLGGGGQRHGREHFFTVRVADLLEQIHRIIGSHQLNELGGVGNILVDLLLDDANGQGGLHFRQGLGRGLIVHLFEDLSRLLLGQRLERVGGVGGLLLLDRLRQHRHVDRVLQECGHTLVVRRGLGHVLDVTGRRGLNLRLGRRLTGLLLVLGRRHHRECTQPAPAPFGGESN